MQAKALLQLINGSDITDIHFRTGYPPILRRSGRLALAERLKPMTGEAIKRLALDLMDEPQKRSFAGLGSVDFDLTLPDQSRFEARLFSQAGKAALSVRTLTNGPAHPSLSAPPVKRHWVRLTRVCNDHCNFCLDSDAQNGTSLPIQAIMADLQKGRDAGVTRVVLSGGEPTMHPDFIDIVARTKELGYTHIQTVTNGRRMVYPGFLTSSVNAGLNEVTFSLHGCTPEMHDSQTGSPGSFVQGLTALRQALKIKELMVSVDVVISKATIRHLRDILDFFIRQGVYEFDLLQVIPFGAAWENKDDLFYDVEKELPHLHRALDLSKRGDVVLWTNRLKPEYLEGYEDLIQPPSKLHDEYKGRGLMFQNFLRLGIKPTCWGRCSNCFLEKSCKDIDELQTKGRLDAHPVPECLKDHPEILLKPEEPSTILEHKSEIPMKEFVDFYIGNRYSVKGAACKSCRFDESCAGAPIDHVRRYGFPKPKPEMLKQ